MERVEMDVNQQSVTPRRRALRSGRSLIGTRREWRIANLPRLIPPSPGRHWIGPLVVAFGSMWFWPVFSNTPGEDGDVSFGLYIGAVSISLMAWSFVLAIRARPLESLFGGLDRAYRVHRWAGALSVAAMYLHTENTDELLRGVPGAGKDVADMAEELAEIAQTALYVLIVLSVVRLVPYRWWRWTHKLLGIPFVIASFHFFTAEKPYANTSVWGWYFNAVMLVGVVAWVWRVLGRDVIARGKRYRVAAVVSPPTATDIQLAPESRPLRHRPGQFAFVKIMRPGISEPHPFSIASSPDADQLRFVVRDLGDWSAHLSTVLTVGDEVRVEGPYGRFQPVPRVARETIWVAGGVGITPFLSAIDAVARMGVVPQLFFAVRSVDDAVALDELRDLDARDVIRLRVFESSSGHRLGPSVFDDPDVAVTGAHVALCGPSELVRTFAIEAHRRGAHRVEHEEFDIRSGIGPDLSREIAAATDQMRARRTVV
jgi:predicted ferric reductase